MTHYLKDLSDKYCTSSIQRRTDATWSAIVS